MRSTDIPPGDPASVVTEGGAWALRPRRLGDRVLARSFGASLDRQLAVGRQPEETRLLAARAQAIVSLRSRRALARNWNHLLRVAHRARGKPHPARPIRGDRIVGAEPAIHELVRRLGAPLPVRAQGVAMASVLLTDATGPVYSRHSRVTLAAALDTAIAQLDPALPLMQATG